MLCRAAIPIALTTLVMATACHSADSEGVSNDAIKRLLVPAGEQLWHVGQYELTHNAGTWHVDAKFTPHAIGQNVCVARLVQADLKNDLTSYRVIRRADRYLIALKTCADAQLSDFRHVDGDTENERMISAANAIFAFQKVRAISTPEIEIAFHDDEAKQFIEYVNASNFAGMFIFHSVQVEDASFFVESIAPRELALRITHRTDGTLKIDVYIDAGPD